MRKKIPKFPKKTLKTDMKIAYRIYPLPNGTVYTEDDIKTVDDIAEIFDYCQILEAVITKKGWDYLIEKFGMDILFLADKKSGWFGCDSMDDFINAIEYEKSISK